LASLNESLKVFFLHFQSEYDPNHFCISQKSFAIGIAIAGLILMVAVVVAILILVSKRRRKNLSTTGNSLSTEHE
jgi:hypothetical protein